MVDEVKQPNWNWYGVCMEAPGVDKFLCSLNTTPIMPLEEQGLRIPAAIIDGDSGNTYDLRDLIRVGEEFLIKMAEDVNFNGKK